MSHIWRTLLFTISHVSVVRSGACKSHSSFYLHRAYCKQANIVDRRASGYGSSSIWAYGCIGGLLCVVTVAESFHTVPQVAYDLRKDPPIVPLNSIPSESTGRFFYEAAPPCQYRYYSNDYAWYEQELVKLSIDLAYTPA